MRWTAELPALARNHRCPCGSGRKFKHCCGRLETAVPSPADDAAAHVNDGNALARLGRLDEAVVRYRRALARQPALAEAHQNLGLALLELGHLEEAAASCRRALELKPRCAAALETLGNAWLLLGHLEEAAASYSRALEIEPGVAEIHRNLGNALRGQGKLDEAGASYQRALEIEPEFAAAHCDLGIAQRLGGQVAAAQQSCRRAIAIDPRSAAAHAALADASSALGRFTEAEELFNHAISIEPDFPEAWAGLARLRKMTHGDAAWLTQAQRIADGPLPARREAPLRHAIGKYFDDVGDFDQAFANFRRANELTRVAHDRRRLTQTVDDITRFYDRAWLAAAARNRTPGAARAVLIVGMLRSGTTLAEQILASHPAVYGAGELTFWSRAQIRYERCAPQAAGDELAGLGAEYLARLRLLSGDALRVIDKMPTNFAFLGLIHAALPGARIIHMRRNPLDTCLSIYCQHFESTVTYANDLEDLAHYHLEYERIMRHWRAVLPADVMLEVPYEGLVGEPERWSRTMVEFAGLPWDARCLDFHATERAVITASQWQVRQRISGASVGRWRNYEKHLGTLRSLLHA